MSGLTNSMSLDIGVTGTILTSSSTRERTEQLHNISDKLSENMSNLDFVNRLLNIFFVTYPYYNDRRSRKAVENCLRIILQVETVAARLIDFIRAESLKSGLAPSNAFVLVEWCSTILQEIHRENDWNSWGLETITSLARALELCLKDSARPSVRKSALAITRRGLRHVYLRQHAIRQAAIEGSVRHLCSQDTPSGLKNAVLLGVIAGVCARNNESFLIVERQKSAYYKFYIREIVGSRAPIPKFIAEGLHDFFYNFTKQDDLDRDIIPALEKALLRAPEVVLNVLSPLFASLPDSVDLSDGLRNKLLKPLLSNLKSTNPSIRQESLSAFRAVTPICRNDTLLSQVAEEILAPLKTGKLSSAEQRAYHADMISALPLSESVVRISTTPLASMLGKEVSEVALVAGGSALCHITIWAILNGLQVEKIVLDLFIQGIREKKAALKRLWILQIGSLLWAFDNIEQPPSAFWTVAEVVVPALLDTWQEVIINPLGAAQSGIITGAYIIAALAHSKPDLHSNPICHRVLAGAQVPQQSLIIAPRPSFLLNPRVYVKLSSVDDWRWFLRALSALTIHITTLESGSQCCIAWTQALIFCICSSEVKSHVRREACLVLTRLYLERPVQISNIMVAGLWHWQQFDENDKDHPASSLKVGNETLYLVIRSICVPRRESMKQPGALDESALRQQMIALLVLCQPKLVPHVNWIDLCLRVQVDPGNLTANFADELFDQILSFTSFDAHHALMIRYAAFDASAQLVFIDPSAMIPRVINQIEEDLDPLQFSDVGPTEAAIFRTPNGIAFIDILAAKTHTVPDKKDKDYDILKWEEEVRAQIAQKTGQQKKLTAEERFKKDEHLKEEAVIRLRIQRLESKIVRGIGIIKSLANGPPTDVSGWIGVATTALLKAIKAGAALIVGRAASDVYLACSHSLPNRIGTLRPFIGVATLRALGVTHLPEALCQESVGALVTRVLYRLRFSGEQRPFDTISLVYILPLVDLVLSQGGFGDQDDAEAQVVLALEFLSFHTDACSDLLVPRAKIISTLIYSMQKYTQHWKLVKECLADLCRCIAPNINREEMKSLVRGVIVPHGSVRTSVLQSISSEIDLSDLGFCDEIWLAAHDDQEENVALGREIWEESEFQNPADAAYTMMPYLDSSDDQLRRAAARGLSSFVKMQPSSFSDVLLRLRTSYQVLAEPKVQKLDVYGMPIKMDMSDPWPARHGIALAFRQMAPIFEIARLDEFLSFLIREGPLRDVSLSVREEMLEAGKAIIILHGKSKVESLMQLFEQTLKAPDTGSEAADRVSEAVIILYGALAQHLRSGEPRVPRIVDMLIATLSTPSESVQFAVADCLPPLVRASSQNAAEYVSQMLEQLLNGKKYAVRRGAGYGLAGLVHGKGISVLREYRTMMILKSAIENKKDVHQREGALLGYELMSIILGRVFEPYVIQIIPQLLSSFGDPSADVRDACLAAARACFASLSSYGVKQVLPILLEGLDDQQWRSKKGACDLLGAMAYLEPQELAQSLPQIIPPLSGVLNDSHKEVRLAANRSLKRFGEVISNPEIKSLVDVLLKALSDPTKYTDDALDALIKVSFVHYLDSPSLALVVRILERGLCDRSATKRKSAQVIGSLAHLTDRKDLISHLPILVAGLKIAVVDPVPTTRATASKALGSLVEKLGEEALPDLIPGLMQTLKSDTGAGDRLGSAQALSEVLAGLGTGRLEDTLPTILQNVVSTKPAVREGFMSLFIFLPVCFGNSFANYLSRMIPPILSGLSDDIESIRDTALRAGRLLVKNFATRAIDLLLPELERGLANDSYRIRLSSVELVGDLLFNLTGISARSEQDEVEEGAHEASASLLDVLGEEKRNKILSSLYICRCDTSGLVRTSAINVWKALVASPRTLRELIPTLTQLIIHRLGSSNMEQKVIAGNALGELIRKAGDNVLSSLLPTLEEGLQTSSDIDTKQGICIALKELISSASSEALADHEQILISVVRTGLVDSSEYVREAAADAFDSLQEILGKKAVDQVLPHLLSLLRSESEAENALSALLTLLTETTRSNIILPNLIPTLTTPPISSFNARALASLSSVAGSSMTRRLPGILSSLMDNIVGCKDTELRTELGSAFDTVLLSVDPYDGLNAAMSVLLGLVRHDDHHRRASTNDHLARFFATTTIDYSRYHQDIIRALLISFDDGDTAVVTAAWTALSELTKHLKKEEMEGLVIPTRQVLQHVGVAGSNLPGFGLPKGVNAILPIFLQGLMNGTSDQKIQSALAIGDVCDRTSGDSLKPFVTQITGPLIRVVSERSVEVKAAILLTLNNLLEKIPIYLKPFLPQLQRTFAKSLADPSSEVLRSRAAKALGTLITLTPRVDPLVSELLTGAKTTDAGVRNTMLKALYEVISKAGGSLSEASRTSILNLIDHEGEDNDITMAITNARLLGALVKNVSSDAAAQLIKHRVMTSHSSQASVLSLNAVLLEAPESLIETVFAKDLPAMLCQGMSNHNPFIADNSVLASGKYLLTSTRPTDFESLKPLFTTIALTIQPGKPVDTRRLALVVTRTICRHYGNLVRPHLSLLAPPIFASVRDPVIPVKLAAEAAFLALFNVVDEESKVFVKYVAGADLQPGVKRSMQDYFKRVALRLGGTARERREAEGGQGGLGLSNDEVEDEKEIWSVGKVDLGEVGLNE